MITVIPGLKTRVMVKGGVMAATEELLTLPSLGQATKIYIYSTRMAVKAAAAARVVLELPENPDRKADGAVMARTARVIKAAQAMVPMARMGDGAARADGGV